MALCLADSLIKRKKFDPKDQLTRYLKWVDEGYLSSNGICFDVGITTRRSLEIFRKTGKKFCGTNDPTSAGNGSIMRLAPVPLFYYTIPEKAIKFSGESSKTTHGAETAIDACRYMGALIVGILKGEKKDKILSSHYEPIPDYWKKFPLSKEIDKIATGSFKEKNPPEICGSGYVVKSLEAALWAFYNSGSFKEGCLMAVNLGDDADTTGAVYGQLAGAFYGNDLIPEKWRKKIANYDLIESMSKRIFTLSHSII
jgi:ADP-ribosylglycohydrolase